MNLIYRVIRVLSRITFSDALKVFLILVVLGGLGLAVRKIWVDSARRSKQSDIEWAQYRAAEKALEQPDGSMLIPLEKDEEFVALVDGTRSHKYVVRNKITRDVSIKLFSPVSGWTTFYTIREHK